MFPRSSTREVLRARGRGARADRLHLGSRLHSAACAYAAVFFFFFQAEDGIRGLYVTGVQTCALPIPAAPCRCTCADRSIAVLSCAPCRSEEHTSELQSRRDLVCRLLLEKKKKKK